MAQNWKEYQIEVAEFFRSLGLSAVVEKEIEGVRGKHKIDVWVTFSQYGINIKWVVECKLWDSPIPKEKVLTLQQIAQDVGADRSFLLSESGFQAGAIRAVGTSNTTLTNLKDLRENSEKAKNEFGLSKLNKRYTLLDSRLKPLIFDSSGAPFPYQKIGKGIIIETMSDLHVIRLALPKIHAQDFPVNIHINSNIERVENVRDFLNLVSPFLDQVEEDIGCLLEQVKAFQIESRELSFLLISAVKKLLKDAEKTLLNKCIEENEENRMDALRSMKRVGHLSDELKSIAHHKVQIKLKSLMRLLIDTVYLYLTKQEIKKSIWDKTRDNVLNKLEDLQSAWKPQKMYELYQV